MSYILYPTAYVSIQKISTQNRSFKYGDGLFESMVMFSNEIPLLQAHYERLIRGMSMLKMTIPDYLMPDFLQNHILTIAEEKQVNHAFIRLLVFRDSEGKYTPKTNQAGILLEIYEIENQEFVLNAKGLTIDIFTEIPKPINSLSSVKTNNCLLYVLAGIFAKEQQLDDCLLINTNRNIIESATANLFLVKDKICITPPLSDACLPGVMRKKVMKTIQEKGLQLIEKSLTIPDLLAADELFLTNAVRGIRWVKQFRDKVYANQIIKIIHSSLP